MTDSDKHTSHPRDQQGQQRATRRIVSTAAALYTLQHADDEQEMQAIRCVLAPAMIVSPPRCYTASLGIGSTVVGDW